MQPFTQHSGIICMMQNMCPLEPRTNSRALKAAVSLMRSTSSTEITSHMTCFCAAERAQFRKSWRLNIPKSGLLICTPHQLPSRGRVVYCAHYQPHSSVDCNVHCCAGCQGGVCRWAVSILEKNLSFKISPKTMKASFSRLAPPVCPPHGLPRCARVV